MENARHKEFFWDSLPRGITLCRCLRQQFSCCLNRKVLLKQEKKGGCQFLKWLNFLRFFHLYIYIYICHTFIHFWRGNNHWHVIYDLCWLLTLYFDHFTSTTPGLHLCYWITRGGRCRCLCRRAGSAGSSGAIRFFLELQRCEGGRFQRQKFDMSVVLSMYLHMRMYVYTALTIHMYIYNMYIIYIYISLTQSIDSVDILAAYYPYII